MDHQFKISLVIIGLVMCAAGLLCQCKPSAWDEQIFHVNEAEQISVDKLNRKLSRDSNSPNQVADLLARTMNKSSVLKVGSYNGTIRELLDLNTYDLINVTDCTINEIEKRQAICDQLSQLSDLRRYCTSCKEGLVEFCRNYPYKRILKATFSKFDWVPHSDLYLFSLNVSTYIIRDGNENLPMKENIASFLATKDGNFTSDLTKYCKSFEQAVKSRLYHFGTTSDQSLELLKDVDDEIYTTWERCKAIKDINEPDYKCRNGRGYSDSWPTSCMY